MTSWLLACAALAACTSAGSVGAGATLDGDGHFGFAADASEGVGNAHATEANSEGFATAAHMLIVGLAVELSVSGGPGRVPCTGQVFADYFHVGSPDAPWGYHVRLAGGGMIVHWLRDGASVFALTAGPIRTVSQRYSESPDVVLYSSTVAWSVDLSLRWRLPEATARPLSHWQLGLLAALHSVALAH